MSSETWDSAEQTAEPTIADRPRPDGSDIRKMTNADVDPVSRSLAQAFHDDPHMRWIFRDDTRRLGQLERAYVAFIDRFWLPQGECYTHESLIGAALWMRPGDWRLGACDQLRMTPAMIRVLGARLPRMIKVLTLMQKRHPKTPQHWYLPMVGVTPSWQGRGYGDALMRPMLDRCDAERVPAYLEASTPQSRALYERLGFEATEECRYANDGPPMWLMWREP